MSHAKQGIFIIRKAVSYSQQMHPLITWSIHGSPAVRLWGLISPTEKQGHDYLKVIPPLLFPPIEKAVPTIFIILLADTMA